jgi:hypothetical protein
VVVVVVGGGGWWVAVVGDADGQTSRCLRGLPVFATTNHT